MGITATRYHDISCGHRVVGHEGKCRFLHGHNYRIHFTVESEDGLDRVGRVLDFSVIKEKLCVWLENKWDHKFLAWDQDPLIKELYVVLGSDPGGNPAGLFGESIVWVPFNPTAENIARHLVEVVGPLQLQGTGCRLTSCSVEETMKCSAGFSTPDPIVFKTQSLSSDAGGDRILPAADVPNLSTFHRTSRTTSFGPGYRPGDPHPKVRDDESND